MRQYNSLPSSSNRLVMAQSFADIRFGNHVGDWEHTMVRFINGSPDSVYFSAHAGGAAYKYSAVEKNGGRPVTYIAIGTHANYPVRSSTSLNSRDPVSLLASRLRATSITTWF